MYIFFQVILYLAIKIGHYACDSMLFKTSCLFFIVASKMFFWRLLMHSLLLSAITGDIVGISVIELTE